MADAGDKHGSSTASFPLISTVTEGSPAAVAGLLVGDVILAINGGSIQRLSLQVRLQY